jgi:hypothetical protein
MMLLSCLCKLTKLPPLLVRSFLTKIEQGLLSTQLHGQETVAGSRKAAAAVRYGDADVIVQAR